MHTSTIHRITCDIKNPSYDARCKYGIQSIKDFRANTLVTIKEWMHGMPWVAEIMVGGESRIIDGSVAASLQDNLTDGKPETVREAIFCRGAASLNINEDLLQALLDNGDIRMEQIDSAITRVFAKWDAEQAA
jgi:hypothetical protein